MVAMVLAGPAHAFLGLGWAEKAANEQLAFAGALKRNYPGLEGEALEKTVREERVNRAMGDALFGKEAPALRGRADELRDRIMRDY